MNDFTLTQLKILVERAVRPVRASIARKRKMREELLAHVTAVFGEESTKLGNAVDALAEATRRFGNPTELTGQLQQSVPWYGFLPAIMDRLRLNFWLRPGESRVYCAIRQSLGFALYCCLLTSTAVLMPVAIIASIAFDLRFFQMACLGQGLAFAYCVIAGAPVIFLVHGTWHAMYGPNGRSWRTLCLMVGLACLVGMSWPAMLHWGLDSLDTGTQTHSESPIKALIAFAVIVPWSLIFGVNLRWRHLNVPEGRRWQATVLVNLGWVALMSGLVFALAMILFCDVSQSLETAGFLWIFSGCWLLPADLIFSAPSVIARLRADREWETLPIESGKGMLA